MTQGFFINVVLPALIIYVFMALIFIIAGLETHEDKSIKISFALAFFWPIYLIVAIIFSIIKLFKVGAELLVDIFKYLWEWVF